MTLSSFCGSLGTKGKWRICFYLNNPEFLGKFERLLLLTCYQSNGNGTEVIVRREKKDADPII